MFGKYSYSEPIETPARSAMRLVVPAAYPEALYLPDHYAKHPSVLARLARLDRDALRDILGAAWLFVTESAERPKRRPSRRTR